MNIKLINNHITDATQIRKDVSDSIVSLGNCWNGQTALAYQLTLQAIFNNLSSVINSLEARKYTKTPK